MKRFFLICLCTVLFFYTGTNLTVGADARYMSTEDARNFLVFIYNSNTDKVTYDALNSDIFYGLLTGKYSGNPDYEESATAGFLSFMEAHIDQYLTKAGVAVLDSHQYLIDYFTKAKENEDKNLAKDICKENVANSIISLCEGEEVFSIADRLTDALENPLKYYEEMKLISSALTYAYGQNVTSLYKYFDSAKSFVYLKTTPGAYETAMSYNIMALRDSNFMAYASLLIPGTTSWEEWIEDMDYWAEYVHDLKGRLASGSFEETYVVVFDSNCEDVESKINWYASGELKAPKMERDGYVLTGWYFDPECTNGPVKDGYMITENLILYAKWEKRYYSITFHSTCSDVADYSYQLDRLNPEWIEPEMTRKGYIFGGWYWDSAYKKPVSGQFTITDNMHFYAKWTCRYEYTVSNGKATITGVKYWETDESGKRTGRVELPEVAGGCPVTSVKFSGWLNGVTTVIFPDSMEEIPAWALNYSISLTNVVLGRNTKKIGSSAFASCSKLESITLNHGLEEVGSSAFAYSKIKEINIPDTVVKISTCFASCQNLENITIPDSVKILEGSAFWGCTSLKTVSIGSGVESIDGMAFGNCESLEAINVSAENKNLLSDNGVLYSKDKTKIYKYPAGKSEKEFTAYAGLTIVGPSAFQNSNLEKITLPDGLLQIQEEAFYNCKSLKNINIPGTLHTIGRNGFAGCEALEEIILPEALTTLGSNAFADCKKIKEIILPDTMEGLGNAVFENCHSLERVTLPKNWYGVQSYMFSGCKALENITLPESITSIGSGAFLGCESLKEIDLSRITSIGAEAFCRCKALEKLTIPDGIERLDYYTIYGCESLKYIALPNSLVQIDFGNFSGGLVSIENVYYMGTEEDWANIYIDEWDNDELKPGLVRYSPSVIAEIGEITEAEGINGKIEFPKLTQDCHMYVAVYDGGRFVSADYVNVKANTNDAEFSISGGLGKSGRLKAFFWDNTDYSPKINAITYNKTDINKEENDNVSSGD